MPWDDGLNRTGKDGRCCVAEHSRCPAPRRSETGKDGSVREENAFAVELMEFLTASDCILCSHEMDRAIGTKYS